MKNKQARGRKQGTATRAYVGWEHAPVEEREPGDVGVVRARGHRVRHNEQHPAQHRRITAVKDEFAETAANMEVDAWVALRTRT